MNEYTLEGWLSWCNLKAVQSWAVCLQTLPNISWCKFQAKNQFKVTDYSLPNLITQWNWGTNTQIYSAQKATKK